MSDKQVWITGNMGWSFDLPTGEKLHVAIMIDHSQPTATFQKCADVNEQIEVITSPNRRVLEKDIVLTVDQELVIDGYRILKVVDFRDGVPGGPFGMVIELVKPLALVA